MSPTRARGAREDRCLVLMLKAAERSKRRLAAEIGERARDVARLLFECALEDVDGWPGPVCFAPADEQDRDSLDGRPRAGDLIVVQQGDNLGERINHVSETLAARGLPRQIYIGMDCPGLDGGYLRDAARALEQRDVVLGPALDGGVVLMGANRAWPDLSLLRWSSTDLFAELCRLCQAHSLTIATLEPRSDVDTLADLAAAAASLTQDARPARRNLSRWLARQPDLLADA
jgi:hypothetical protein